MRILEMSSAPPPSSSPPPPESSPPPPASSAPPPASSPPPPVSSSPPPPPAASSPPPPARSSPPPPVRKSPPPSNGTKSRTPPPPLPPSESDENWSGAPQSLAESISFPWQPPSSNNNGPDQKVIIGAVVGVGLFFIIIVIVCVCCCRKKKKRSNRDDRKNYYPQKPHNSGGNYYNNTGAQRNWQSNAPYSSMDGNMKYPPPPPSSGLSSEHWMAAPPPPPPMSAQSSAGFSGPPLPPPHPAVAWTGYNQSTFSYNDLASATGGFAQANLLGQGGFGYVHKGVLPNGKEIAVKSLKLNSGQGEREFQAEVDIISRVHHRHLVSLVGYCISGSQRMLVYEYVPNSTLEYHLHGSNRPTMDWSTRLKLALGAAKGFAYLHEDCHPRIIHRDIKAANILLDNNSEAKVADFGLAKLSSDNNTHVSTRIMGTFGYLAPEYASSGKLTEKSDVYSFGIVLLELITGRRPVDITRDDDDDTLVDWARPILMSVAEGGSYEELVDPRLQRNYDHAEMLRMVSSAAACIRQSARKRPKMSQVVRALEGDVSLDDLHETMMKSQGSLSASSSDYDLQRHIQKPNQEYTSSELGAASDSSPSSGGSYEMRRPSPGYRYQGP